MSERRINNGSEMGFDGGFSVLMATYGGDSAELLRRAISSVYDNKLAPDEFVLVVDGPVGSELAEALSEMTRMHPEMNVIQLPVNIGLAGALNKGLSACTKKWIVRADSDDFNLPDRFSTLSTLVRRNPGVGLIGSGITEVTLTDETLSNRIPPTDHEQICSFLRRRNPFNHMTVAYLRESALQVGGYPDLRLKEDYAFWAVLIHQGTKCMNTSEVLVRATAGPDMIRRRGGLAYAAGEISLQKLLWRLGFKSIGMAVVDGLARAAVFLAPASIRALVYSNFLRKPVGRN